MLGYLYSKVEKNHLLVSKQEGEMDFMMQFLSHLQF